MQLCLGIDIACRAAHQASLADEEGSFIWTGWRFRTSAQDLGRLWAMRPEDSEPQNITVIMEPTRNAWVSLAGTGESGALRSTPGAFTALVAVPTRTGRPAEIPKCHPEWRLRWRAAA